MANLSVEEPDALMCARPGLWEPWRATARATRLELQFACRTEARLVFFAGGFARTGQVIGKTDSHAARPAGQSYLLPDVAALRQRAMYHISYRPAAHA